MRLSELLKPAEIDQFRKNHKDSLGIRVREKPSDWRTDVYNFAAKYGLEKIGTGAFGMVFGHAGLDYVLKVFRNDPAFIQWVQFCIQNQNNPIIPKIRGKMVAINQHYYAVRMERLAECTNSTVHMIYETLANYPKDVLEKPMDPTTFYVFLQNYIDVNYLKPVKEYIPRYEDIAPILKFLNNRQFDVDLHMGNVMMRGNQLVIVDPILPRV